MALLLGLAAGTAAPPTSAEGRPATHRVVIDKFVFRPAILRIRAGDRVVFVNRDFAPHTATDRRGRWDTGSLPRGGERRVTFGRPGRFAYFCRFHPHMRGTVIVTGR